MLSSTEKLFCTRPSTVPIQYFKNLYLIFIISHLGQFVRSQKYVYDRMGWALHFNITACCKTYLHSKVMYCSIFAQINYVLRLQKCYMQYPPNMNVAVLPPRRYISCKLRIIAPPFTLMPTRVTSLNCKFISSYNAIKFTN